MNTNGGAWSMQQAFHDRHVEDEARRPRIKVIWIAHDDVGHDLAGHQFERITGEAIRCSSSRVRSRARSPWP